MGRYGNLAEHTEKWQQKRRNTQTRGGIIGQWEELLMNIY
jgi:hypothetical protein